MAKTPETPAPPPVSFKDDPQAPEFFSDGVAGIFIFNDTVRLAFESYRVDHSATPGPVNRVVTCRIVLPIRSAENLRDLLTDFIAKQKAGSLPLPQAPGSPTMQ